MFCEIPHDTFVNLKINVDVFWTTDRLNGQYLINFLQKVSQLKISDLNESSQSEFCVFAFS